MDAKKTYTHCGIAVLIGLIIAFALPATNGLSADGVHLLSILIPTIYLWITVGTDWVSLAALAALVMTGVMTNGKNFYAAVYAGSMGNFIILTIIACMALSAVMTTTGVIEKIAVWFITRKFVQGRPYAFLFMFLLSNLLVGTFMEATAVAIMYIDLAKSILDKLGYKKGDKFYSCVMAGLYWNNAIVSAGSPISHVLPLLLIAAAAPALGVTISFGQWLMVGIPFEILAFALEIIVFRFIWRPETGRFDQYDVEEVKRNSAPLSKQGKITLSIFAIVVILWLFPQFGKSIAPGFVTYLNQIGACVPPVLGLTALFVIQVDGKPVARFGDCMKTIPMGMLIFTACVTVLGAAVNLENTGISIWLGNILTPALQGLPTFTIMALLVFLALALSQFMSDTVTMYLIYSIAIVLLGTTGINMPAFIIIVGLASIMGLLTPAAAVPSPLFFGPELITVKNSGIYCIIFLLMVFVILMAILWPLASAVVVF